MQSISPRVFSDEIPIPSPIGQNEIKRISYSPECRPIPTPTCYSVDIESNSIRYFGYKAARCFEHFYYVYNLARDCKSRIEEFENNDTTKTMSKGVVIKIGIVGMFTNDNLNLVSKCKGKSKLSENDQIWQAIPLLCFQNDLSLESALNMLSKESACHRILIKSDTDCDKFDTEAEADRIIVVNQNKENIQETITTCLEKPLHQMLQRWKESLKTKTPTRLVSKLIAEIEDISKQMVPDNRKDKPIASIVTNVDTKCIVPEDVKNYLFRTSDVLSFGIWRNSTFKVFVTKDTDEKYLNVRLTSINQPFFKEYHLEIEKSRLVEKWTMKQGDHILHIPPKEEGKCYAGTLGGFVSKNDNEKMIYALTCNHAFPSQNQSAYADVSHNYTEIGKCVFTTREKSCDFAAVKIKDSFINKCDVAFRREDKKKTNAKVYTQSLENVQFVHKIGAETGVTNGRVVSYEYYNKVIDAKNQDYVFLVEGTNGIFSTKGDSGSLVFTRPKTAAQNFVYVLGMVYASNLTIRDEDEFNIADENNLRCLGDSQSKDKETNADHASDKPRSKTSISNEGVDDSGAIHAKEDENLTSCCRLYTALELFKKNQGEDFEVSFKDDLSFTSSQSSNSDDSNEETS